MTSTSITLTSHSGTSYQDFRSSLQVARETKGMLDQIVVVGAGQAAAQAVETLRRRGFVGSIIIVGDEPSLPYQRPPLSKKYLAGQFDRDRLFIRHAAHYDGHAIDMRLGRRAVKIARRERCVKLDDGSKVSYDALLLTTGSRPRTLAIPGAELDGVCYLRTIGDVDALRAELQPGRKIVIVGGGFIGLEVAATCRQLGLEVTVMEMAERVMKRVVCAEVSRFLEAEHARRGVSIVCNSEIKAFVARADTQRVGQVICKDGTEHPADIVLIGIGVSAADELAVASDLDCSNGILVDEHCRTHDERIYAAGDCTNHPSIHFGGRVRLESVDNAFEQATTAALNILGQPVVHDKIPWFWSDQYDLKLIIVGLSGGHDCVVIRGDPSAGSFSACYLRGGELLAIDSVNSLRDQMAARKLIPARVRPDPAKLADVTIQLKDCI